MNFLKHLVNRNPRSLEKLGLAKKNLGYQFEKDAKLKQFYYKLEYESSLRNITARVVHYKDGEVASASTLEPEIHKRLHSRVDYSANWNLGRILADRCLKAGIDHVEKGVSKEDFEKIGNKMKAFYDGCSKGGLILSESSTIEVNWELDKRYHFIVPEQLYGREYKRKFIPPQDDAVVDEESATVDDEIKTQSPTIDDEVKKDSKGKKKRSKLPTETDIKPT